MELKRDKKKRVVGRGRAGSPAGIRKLNSSRKAKISGQRKGVDLKAGLGLWSES